MTESVSTIASDVRADAPAGSWLVRVLFAGHFAISLLVPPAAAVVPKEWEAVRDAIHGVLVGQLMALGFWAGLGRYRGTRELWALLWGSSWLSLVFVVTMALETEHWGSPIEALLLLVVAFGIFFVMLAVLTTALLVLRLNGFELARYERPAEVDAAAGWRFSILQLLVVTVAAALYLAAARAAATSGATVWPVLVFVALAAVTLLTAALLPICAVLLPGRTWVRLLGAVTTIALAYFVLGLRDTGDARQASIDTAAFAPALAVFVGSLYLVRCDGWRLGKQQGRRKDEG